MSERQKPKRLPPPGDKAPSGLGRLWRALTGNLNAKPSDERPLRAPEDGRSALHERVAKPMARVPATRPPPELAQLFLAHPAARRMFPSLWRLAGMWALPGSDPLAAAALELLREAVRELDGLISAGQPSGLQALRRNLTTALAVREAAPAKDREDDRLRSRFGEERLEVGETSMDDFVQEQQAWGKTEPGRLPASH
jgi:hypothetical protein